MDGKGGGALQARLTRDQSNGSAQDEQKRRGQLLPPRLLRMVALLSSASSPLTPAEQMEHAVLLTLAREPTDKELSLVQPIYAAADGDAAAALERIFWVLLNTAE
jgi:hypothetical protein